ncbi:hypothetical protein [Olleya namhaensis]|uniref:Tissue inhibitor of metalloproteinase n=1 Tax=Olleya namhaensis TaxID=1144750 RepID=A0A1I3PQF6_9FLAO|nr:hypothetical protein [Olleya namhaensis]SFJ23699.1 Tissue inhibitor of metalloproteinase [Olleya namhaensis]
MKKILYIIMLLLSVKSFACKCSTQNIENNYIQSDFVAKIKILKKYLNIENNDYYKVDIQILDLYKGNSVKSIFIYGNYLNRQDSACWIFTQINEDLVIYATKTNQNYQLEMCSNILRVNRKTNSNTTNKRHQKEIKILENLKLNKVEFTNHIRFTSEDFHPMRRENYGIKLKREFAIFELTFNEDLSVKCVKKIQGFRNKIDRNIKSFFKTSQWSSLNKNYKKNKIMKNTKTLVIIYYKVDEKNNIGYITNKF